MGQLAKRCAELDGEPPISHAGKGGPCYEQAQWQRKAKPLPTPFFAPYALRPPPLQAPAPWRLGWWRGACRWVGHLPWVGSWLRTGTGATAHSL